jgi:hypothetical protein
MVDNKWEVVDQVAGELQAELIRGILEAQDIEVVLSQEGIGHIYATTVGLFGRVQILVPAADVPRAQQILKRYYDEPQWNEGEDDAITLDDQDQ